GTIFGKARKDYNPKRAKAVEMYAPVRPAQLNSGIHSKASGFRSKANESASEAGNQVADQTTKTKADVSSTGTKMAEDVSSESAKSARSAGNQGRKHKETASEAGEELTTEVAARSEDLIDAAESKRDSMAYQAGSKAKLMKKTSGSQVNALRGAIAAAKLKIPNALNKAGKKGKSTHTLLRRAIQQSERTLSRQVNQASVSAGKSGVVVAKKGFAETQTQITGLLNKLNGSLSEAELADLAQQAEKILCEGAEGHATMLEHAGSSQGAKGAEVACDQSSKLLDKAKDNAEEAREAAEQHKGQANRLARKDARRTERDVEEMGRELKAKAHATKANSDELVDVAGGEAKTTIGESVVGATAQAQTKSAAAIGTGNKAKNKFTADAKQKPAEADQRFNKGVNSKKGAFNSALSKVAKAVKKFFKGW
ncbi:MAG: hypothetical protein HN348_23125, partial [Proteobacteria bacterium]|nr:hypothetical protein [Pseudomonadota bacterium]